MGLLFVIVMIKRSAVTDSYLGSALQLMSVQFTK